MRDARARAVVQMRETQETRRGPIEFLDLQIAMRRHRIDGAGDALSVQLEMLLLNLRRQIERYSRRVVLRRLDADGGRKRSSIVQKIRRRMHVHGSRSPECSGARRSIAHPLCDRGEPFGGRQRAIPAPSLGVGNYPT